MIEAFAWSGWLWAICIYIALRSMTLERNHWRKLWLECWLASSRKDKER